MNSSLFYLRYFIALCFAAILLPLTGFGQNEGHASLENTVAAINNKHENQPAEKLYLHVDRSWYKASDTIWYKAYLLNGGLAKSAQSGLLYVELINDSNRVVKRQRLEIRNGAAIGQIGVKRNMYPGIYTLRAYTNWMRNFGQDHFFSCQLNVVPSVNQYWLISKQQAIGADKNITLGLHFTDLTAKNIGFRDMLLSVLDGNKILQTKKSFTDPYGNLSFKFGLPEKKDYKHLTVVAEDVSKEEAKRKILIPVQLNRTEYTDLQFMPEGGTLLTGVPARVGFKAIGEDGLGVNGIKGQIYNAAMKEEASFQSMHKGMGSFEFTPEPGENYTAKVTFTDGTTKSYALPTVKSSGVVMHVKDLTGKDSLELQVLATRDILQNDGKNYSLIGEAGDKVCYAEEINLGDKEIIKKIAKNIFPEGVVKFTLFNKFNEPVTGRMAFIDHGNELNINITTNKNSYIERDSVSLQVNVTDAGGKPVRGSFSLAVTDDGVVKATDENAENLKSYMLLSSDMKGTIEDPGYYFNKVHADRTEALDNLLLTQGWVNYDWKKTFGDPEKPEYEAEPEFIVKGSVNNIFNKPIADAEIKLKSDIPRFTLTTVTDKKGHFSFDNFPKLEVIDFKIESTRDFNIGINVDTFTPPGYQAPENHEDPWYVNSDSTYISYITNRSKITSTKAKPEEVFDRGKSKLLREVVIKNNHLRQPPPVHLALDEEDVRNARAGKKPLNLMKLLNYKDHISQMFKLLIVDEIPYISSHNMTSVEAQWEVNKWLESHTTDDIVGFKVEGMFVNTSMGEIPAMRIYVTSNSGVGPIETANAYAYHPIPLSQPHQFYAPRYNAKTPVTGNDKRSTIFWEPDITTDDSGKATVSFYTADMPGTYSLVLQGADMRGNVGYKRQQLTIAGIGE